MVVPKTLSASSLKVFMGCQSRYYHENILRSATPDNRPALVGTAVHGALEEFVKATRLSDSPMPWELEVLIVFYKNSYEETFGDTDFSSEFYKDGEQMLKVWFARSGDLQTTEVLSVEIKSNFPVKTSVGDIPVTYIWDRCDKLDEETVRVVDYKTIRVPVTAAELKTMIQPKLYALAAQFQFPWAKKIWVQFDLLRHERVGVVIDVEESRATYYFIKRTAEKIIATNPDELRETLNADCRYCIRKTECESLASHAGGGGILSQPIPVLVKRKAQIDAQLEGLKWLENEINEALLREADEQGQMEFEVEDEDGKYKIEVKGSVRRSVDADSARKILGEELSAQYGNIGVTQIDKIMKDPDVDDEIKSKLKQLISRNITSPSAKVKKVDL